MASSLEFVQYAADQLSDAGTISYRKMFGEYGLYCDGKFFGCICDDQFFVKMTEAGKRLAPEMEKAMVPRTSTISCMFMAKSSDCRQTL